MGETTTDTAAALAAVRTELAALRADHAALKEELAGLPFLQELRAQRGREQQERQRAAEKRQYDDARQRQLDGHKASGVLVDPKNRDRFLCGDGTEILIVRPLIVTGPEDHFEREIPPTDRQRLANQVEYCEWSFGAATEKANEFRRLIDSGHYFGGRDWKAEYKGLLEAAVAAGEARDAATAAFANHPDEVRKREHQQNVRRMEAQTALAQAERSKAAREIQAALTAAKG